MGWADSNPPSTPSRTRTPAPRTADCTDSIACSVIRYISRSRVSTQCWGSLVAGCRRGWAPIHRPRCTRHSDRHRSPTHRMVKCSDCIVSRRWATCNPGILTDTHRSSLACHLCRCRLGSSPSTGLGGGSSLTGNQSTQFLVPSLQPCRCYCTSILYIQPRISYKHRGHQQ